MKKCRIYWKIFEKTTGYLIALVPYHKENPKKYLAEYVKLIFNEYKNTTIIIKPCGRELKNEKFNII